MCFTIVRFLILLIIFFSTNAAISNNGELRLSKLHYENASGEKGITTYEYYDYGIMYRAKWELLDGSRYSHNYHTLDKSGNMIRKYREFSDGMTTNLIYKYDENGYLTGEYFERSDGVTGTTKYIYNNTGEPVKAECKGLNGWFHGILIYKHDENGRKVGAIINQKGDNVGAISYTYDEKGHLIEEYWDFSGKWSQTFAYEYEKHENGFPVYYTSSNVFINKTSKFRLEKEDYDFNNSNGGPSYFEYDKTGKLIKKIFERLDGLKTETTFEYDEKGILNKSYRKYSNGQEAIFTYEFNGNRKLTRRKFEHSDGSSGSEEYEFDGKFNLTKAVYKNFDSWLTGTITFEHDKNGNLSKGHFKGEKFDAEIFFKNDKFGNIGKIHWVFSFGKTQTYTFHFEKI
jgi:hypothetical protein